MTGNIIPGMIIHFMNNGLSTYVSYGSVNDWPLADFITSITNASAGGGYLSTLLIIFLALIASTFLLVWLVYLLIHETAGIRLRKLTTDLAKSLVTEGQNQSQMNSMNYVNINIPSNILGFNPKQVYKPPLKEKIFLYGAFFLGGFVTLMTFITGVI